MAEAEQDIYTKDGTVDYRNKPAIKKETGTWKACPYILGTYCLYLVMRKKVKIKINQNE